MLHKVAAENAEINTNIKWVPVSLRQFLFFLNGHFLNRSKNGHGECGELLWRGKKHKITNIMLLRCAIVTAEVTQHMLPHLC